MSLSKLLLKTIAKMFNSDRQRERVRKRLLRRQRMQRKKRRGWA